MTVAMHPSVAVALLASGVGQVIFHGKYPGNSVWVCLGKCSVGGLGVLFGIIFRGEVQFFTGNIPEMSVIMLHMLHYFNMMSSI